MTVVRTADLLAAGLSGHDLARQVRDGRRTRLRRGVLTAGRNAGSDLDRSVARAASALVLVPDAVVSHAAAAAVHGLPVATHDAVVCVTRPDRSGNRRRPDPARVHLHSARLGAADVRRVRELAVTSPARAICDLARATRGPAALVPADAALAAGIVSLGALAALLREQGGWPGSRAAARVLALADPGAESPLESLVRGLLVLDGGLPVPVLQHPVRGGDGRTFRVDLCWPDRRTVLEVDGRVKYDDPRSGSASAALWAEKRREDSIREAGWAVVRVVADDVHGSPALLVGRVRAAFERAAREHGRPPPSW